MALLEHDLRSTAISPHSPSTTRPTMDVVTIGKIVLRRWYVTLIGLAITAASLVGVAQAVQPTYKSTGSFLVAGPAIRGESPGDQGVLAHVATSQGMIDALTTGASRAALTMGGGTTSYSLQTSPDGSVLTVEAVAARPEDAVETVRAVTEAIHREAALQQEAAGVPASQLRETRTITDASMETVAHVSGPETDDGEARYASHATVLLIDPTDGLDNPYASSTFTIRVLEETLMAPIVSASVLNRRQTTYVIGQRDRDAAPILYVEASGTDADEVQATFSDVAARVRTELEERQLVAGVDESKFMTIEPLSIPMGPTVSSTNLKRPLAAVLGLGGIATVAVAVLADGFLAPRPRREEERESLTGGDPPPS